MQIGEGLEDAWMDGENESRRFVMISPHHNSRQQLYDVCVYFIPKKICRNIIHRS